MNTTVDSIIVTAEEMGKIEAQIFAAGMPVAALMEKAAFLTTQRVKQLYPLSQLSRVGVLVGPGHNGGDALVIARELHLAGYQVCLYRPLSQLKQLTSQHFQYAQELLSIPIYETIESLEETELIIDGLFGFGLTRPITGTIATAVDTIKQWHQPVVSIDIPSGIHTDTGEVLGTAIRANHTLCLGLWKRAFFQDQALEYIGQAERIDFGIPTPLIAATLGETPLVQQINTTTAQRFLPSRPLVTHKYQQGHLLLICGSLQYAGGTILTGLGARASGVGMLSIAVPESLKPLLVTHLPEALIIGCPETSTGAIASIPVDFQKYQVIACGPGLTLEAESIIRAVMPLQCPLVLDADGLNIIAQKQLLSQIASREYPTILTPHLGEFRRLFPQIEQPEKDRIRAVISGAKESNSIVLLKGALSAIASPDGTVWLLKESTPALARGGSGDVLTGLIGGLIAQNPAQQTFLTGVVATAAWWHAQAGILAAKERSELGVDAFTLSQYLCLFELLTSI